VDGDFRLGTWLVHPSLNCVSRNGTSVQLEPKVMSVLVCLAEHRGEPVSKEQLLQTVWPDTFVGEGVLTRSISELRRVFEDDTREPKVIQTISKRGYRLLAPVGQENGSLNGGSAGIDPALAARKHNWQVAWLTIAGVVVVCGLLVGFNVGDLRAHIFTVNPPIHSLAVLPLKNLSEDPSQGYFASGMTEELITDLSQISALKVISRASSDLYEGTHQALPEIARELRVEGIITGSVARSGNRVRVSVQLAYAPEDRNLWAKSYERDLQNALALQGAVAKAIAEEIRVQVAPNAMQTRANPTRMTSATVLDNYLQGNYHLHRSGWRVVDEEKRLAAESFQRAIDEDPAFAPAYVGLAYAHAPILVGGGGMSNPSPRDYQTRKAAIEKALELNPDSSEAHILQASLYCDDWRWSQAEQELQRGIALNPNSADAHDTYGTFLYAVGRPVEGMQESEIAQGLDPKVDHMSGALGNSGRNDEAIALLLRDMERDPDNSQIHIDLFQIYVAARRYPEAIKEMEEAGKLTGFGDLVPAVDRAFKTAGFEAAIRVVTTDWEKLHKQGRLYAPGWMSGLYAIVGDKDRAFYWLEDAYRHPHSTGADGGLLWLKGNSMYDSLRSDPRYADLVRRVGLPQ